MAAALIFDIFEKEQPDLAHGRTSSREAGAKFPQVFRNFVRVSNVDHLILSLLQHAALVQPSYQGIAARSLFRGPIHLVASRRTARVAARWRIGRFRSRLRSLRTALPRSVPKARHKLFDRGKDSYRRQAARCCLLPPIILKRGGWRVHGTTGGRSLLA
jgi:hypothetical protein